MRRGWFTRQLPVYHSDTRRHCVRPRVDPPTDLHEEHPEWTSSTAGSAQSWITLPYGTSSIWFAMLFSNQGPAVELYFGSSDEAQNLLEHERWQSRRNELETAFGNTLVFDALPGKKACRVRYYKPGGGDVLDSAREEHLAWFLSTFAAFRQAVLTVKPTLPPAAADTLQG